MTILDTLITDRTSADLIVDSDKVYADYICLNRVEDACKYLADILNVSIKTKTWTMQDFRTQTEMDRLRNNIEMLRNAYFIKQSTPKTPSVITYSNIYQANDIEQILKDVGDMYYSTVSRFQRFEFKLGTKSLGNRR